MTRLLSKILFLVTFILCNLLTFMRCTRILCVCDASTMHRPFIGNLKQYYYLCTHMVLTYATYNGSHFIRHDVCNVSQQAMDSRRSIILKILISLGHLNEGPESLIAAALGTRNEFANALAEFVRLHNFDGVHLEWSNFGAQVYRYYQKNYFLHLAKAIKAVFMRHRFVLTVSLPAIKKQLDQGFLVKDLSDAVDFITIRTLDMCTAKDNKVGLSSALFANSGAKGDDRMRSMDWVARYVQSLGVHPYKINVAIPTYARTFTLANESRTDIGDAARRPGYAGVITRTTGILSSAELCANIQRGGQLFNVPSQQGRYYVNGNQWYSFDDIYSVLLKACYVKDKLIGGFSFWTIELSDDDSRYNRYRCGDGPHPLIATAVNTYEARGFNICTPVNNYTFVSVPPERHPTASPPPEYVEPPKKRVVCCFVVWAYHRRSYTQFVPENINGDLCTHIVYHCALVSNKTITPYSYLDESENWRKGLFYRAVQGRKTNPNLKFLLRVGGLWVDTEEFENVANNAVTRWSFSKRAVKYLREMQFDGLEIDWHYVTIKHSLNYVRLINNLRVAFDYDAIATGKPRLLLSTTLPADKSIIDRGYQGFVTALINDVDFFSVLSYDFNVLYTGRTGFNAPLYASTKEFMGDEFLNVDWVVRYYVSLGLPKSLINVGISTYCRSFTLRDVRNSGVGDETSELGKWAWNAATRGILSYFEICGLIARGARTVRVPEQKAVYAVKGDQWFGYEDVTTVTDKACYALEEGYGGVTVWSLDRDDFNGWSCGESYPLTKRIYNIMNNLTSCTSYISRQASGAHRCVQGSILLYFGLLLLCPVAR